MNEFNIDSLAESFGSVESWLNFQTEMGKYYLLGLGGGVFKFIIDARHKRKLQAKKTIH